MGWASRHNLLANAVNRNLGGVPVTAGAATGTGILEKNARLVIDDNIIDVNYLLSNLPADQFSTLTFGDPITVAGDPYTVREPLPVGDGMFMVVSLEKIEVFSIGGMLTEEGGYFLLETGGRLVLEET